MTGRLRLRRRLYLFSAPFCLVVLLAGVKMISVVLIGDSARTEFNRHDIEALASDVSMLEFVDVVQPRHTALAAGALDVLAGRLPAADSRFGESLRRTDQVDSCPVRINLVLVRETLGDLAFRDGDRNESIRRYRDAIIVAEQAPENCFAGNDDADEQRRAIRADTLPRLNRKLDLVSGPAVAPPPPPAVAPAPPPAGVSAQERQPPEPAQEERGAPGRTLGGGDAEDRLRRLLDEANAEGDNRE